MKIEAGATYGIKGSDQQSDFVRADGIEDGHVKFFPLNGGFLHKAPLQEFIDKFEPVSEDRMRNILRTFSRVMVDTDTLDRAIPAWSNGSAWNGWEVPYFEREEIEKAIADGTLDDSHTKIVLLEDAALELLSIDGELPEGHDWNAIADELREGGEVFERDVEGCCMEARLCLPVEIEAEGRTMTVFPLGDGWCWQAAEDPAPKPGA